MNKIKVILQKLLKREKYSSDTFVKYLRSKGVRIGTGTTIYVPSKVLIDMTRPWLIEIGSNVQITEGVTILTHGFDWSVLKNVYGDILGSSGKVTIGDNVFIGMQSTILKGVTIGSNTIIGANTLVNKDVPENCVFAGVPGKVIMTLDDYHQKRVNAQYSEAVELVTEYKTVYGSYPPPEKLHEFFWLFTNADENRCELYEHMMQIGGGYQKSLNALAEHTPKFSSYKEFIDFIDRQDN